MSQPHSAWVNPISDKGTARAKSLREEWTWHARKGKGIGSIAGAMGAGGREVGDDAQEETPAGAGVQCRLCAPLTPTRRVTEKWVARHG